MCVVGYIFLIFSLRFFNIGWSFVDLKWVGELLFDL